VGGDLNSSSTATTGKKIENRWRFHLSFSLDALWLIVCHDMERARHAARRDNSFLCGVTCQIFQLMWAHCWAQAGLKLGLFKFKSK